MLNEDDYEVLKGSLLESNRLFGKLNKVATNIENIDYDESGLYQEDEDIYERHWLKLSSKIIDNLDESLDGFNIELLKNDNLESRELTLNLIKEDIKHKIKVDYSEDDSLNIIQIS